ncbi:hypothetical protein C8R45DRAFT_1095300 [Mycena sanguinolenta]|nr:hypothetical protein C8R45DRAFT_1095300 [Mycena sanguinolenta]
MPRVLTLLRRSQSLPLPRRDAYPLSTAFGLTGTKAARYRSIQATITQALVTLAGPMPEGLPRDFSGHTLIRPRMNTGATRLKDAGDAKSIRIAVSRITPSQIHSLARYSKLIGFKSSSTFDKSWLRPDACKEPLAFNKTKSFQQWTLCLRKKLLLLLQR